MKEWFESKKPILIFLGIVYILLALFVVSSYVRTDIDLIAIGESKGVALVLFDSFKNISDVLTNLKISFSNFSEYISAMGTFTMVYWIAAIILTIAMKQSSGYEKIEHGSADWATSSEAYGVLSPKEGFILAQKYFFPVIPEPPTAKNGNILVIGGSGSGKSASFAIPNAMQMLGTYIFTDPKGELYDRTAGLFKNNGYEIHVINLADPKYSDGYNPLSHIRGTTDVDIITKIISKKDDKGASKSADPFWDQTSEALLKAMIYYILLNRPKEEHSLASCLSLVRLGGENEGEDLRNLFMDLDHSNPARRAFETIRLGSEKTFSNILVSLAAKLEAFDSEEIVALTSTNTIEFEELASKKSAVYFITPESHSTYDFLMNIFFSQLFQRVYEFGDQHGGKLPIPMFLILDEFANIGRIPNFERVISTCRSKRLHLSIILQSIDQLMEIYDEKVTETIMSNCSTHLFLGSNAQKTLETFSKQLGEKTISRDNISRNTDKTNQTSGYGYSDQIMARALMTPDELRRMSKDECIILIQGLKPIKARKYWYFTMHPKEKERKSLEISHLSLEFQKRGDYVITNPYKIIEGDYSSNDFDSLFGEKSVETMDVSNVKKDPVVMADDVSKSNTDILIDNMITKKSEPAMQSDSNDDDEYDLQAELEKRFDELFGTPKKKNVFSE